MSVSEKISAWKWVLDDTTSGQVLSFVFVSMVMNFRVP